jgi:tetratricopeptide (TPR) repeat protein
VVLLLGGGAFAWWRDAQAQAGRERDARNAEAVAALLGQAKEALKAGDAAKAKVALEAARKRSAEGGAEDQALRLRGLEADLALLRGLDAVDRFRWTPVVSKLPDPAAVATRTREALTRLGLDPEAVAADEAAARVSASVVPERIVAALDRLLRQQQTEGVRALLRRVDADPYRDAVRDAVLAQTAAKIAELVGQKAALEQPASFAAFLGESGAVAVERKRQLLQAALAHRPGDLHLLMTLGGTYPINQKDGADERLRWFQAAVAAAPKNTAAHNNLGLALDDKGQWDAAIACYQKAIELDPKYALAHMNLGVTLSRKGQLDAAIACHKKAIELDPKDALAHYNLGWALAGKGQLDAAIACFKKAIELDPKNAQAHVNLADILANAADPKFRDPVQAIAHAKKATELAPQFFMGWGNLGEAYYRNGQWQQAIANLDKGLALYKSDHSEFFFFLAMAHHRAGHKDEARKWYDKAIAWMDKNAPKDAALLRFRTEAAEVLGVK